MIAAFRALAMFMASSRDHATDRIRSDMNRQVPALCSKREAGKEGTVERKADVLMSEGYNAQGIFCSSYTTG